MNPNYSHTITLYNRIRAADTQDKKERWVRTVLEGCFYKSQISVSYVKTQETIRNVYTVRIPEQETYLPYAEFIENPTGHFTMSQGDLVVYGRCEEEITGEAGNTAAEFLSRHQPDAFRVTVLSDNTRYLHGKHYRLGG